MRVHTLTGLRFTFIIFFTLSVLYLPPCFIPYTAFRIAISNVAESCCVVITRNCSGFLCHSDSVLYNSHHLNSSTHFTCSLFPHRFHSFLLYLGQPSYSVREIKITHFCKIISEFSLEYRTTRERVLTQKRKRAAHRERTKTRGKLITEVRNAPQSPSSYFWSSHSAQHLKIKLAGLQVGRNGPG